MALRLCLLAAVLLKETQPYSYCSEERLAALRALKWNMTVYVAIMSSPTVSGYERREAIRRRCGCVYDAAGIAPKFYVGLPLPWAGADNRRSEFFAKKQGSKAAPDAVKTSDAIVAEATREGDVVPLFMWETYAATSAKVAALMRDGAASADFVVKVDDDRCVAPKPLHDALAEFSRSRAPGEELYLGTYLFKGTEYTSMEGYDGTTSPFQAGPTYALSAGLARSIFVADRLHTTFHYKYGTEMEDSNVGKWVRYAKETRGVAVRAAVKRDISFDVETGRP